MSRLKTLSDNEVPQQSRALTEFIRSSLGWVPNFFRVCANSPAALSGFSFLDNALGQTLEYQLRTQIAVAVSQVNDAAYCLAGHTYYATRNLKLTQEEIAYNRAGASSDDRTNAAVFFACRVAEQRGHLKDEDLGSVRRAGFSDCQIVEFVAVVASTCFTNFLNSVAETDVDYPVFGEIN
jgi:uncharacterized peroxidase-related enzyme